MFSLLILRFTDTNKPLSLLRGRHAHHANRSRRGTRKRRSTDESFVETLVVADRTMVDAFKSKADLQAYILTLMGVVRSRSKFLNPTGQNEMEQHAFTPPPPPENQACSRETRHFPIHDFRGVKGVYIFPSILYRIVVFPSNASKVVLKFMLQTV